MISFFAIAGRPSQIMRGAQQLCRVRDRAH
jgi:hypothetical protein